MPSIESAKTGIQHTITKKLGAQSSLVFWKIEKKKDDRGAVFYIKFTSYMNLSTASDNDNKLVKVTSSKQDFSERSFRWGGGRGGGEVV